MKTRTRRKRQHGVALTESLIALCLLIILFVGTTFFHAMYSAKAASMQTARMKAWAGTRFDCSGTEANGTASITVPVPMQIRTPSGAAQRNVQAAQTLVCNMQPDQSDGFIDVLAWAGGAAAQGISTDSFGAIVGEIGPAIRDAALDLLNPFN